MLQLLRDAPLHLLRPGEQRFGADYTANVLAGSITHPAVAETFGLSFVDPLVAAGRIA